MVWFDYRQRPLNEEMSLAADARVVWGGREAVRAITALPRREHCVDVVFGPKYSIGLIDRKRLEAGGEALEDAVAGFVRDVAVFDQRACSAPQTIFIERNARRSLAEVGRDVRRGAWKNCRRSRGWTPTRRRASPASAPSGRWTRHATCSPRPAAPTGRCAWTAKSR